MGSISRRIFVMIAISTVLFSLGGVIIYKAAEALPISQLIFLYASGGFFGIFAIYKTKKIGISFRATKTAYLFAVANSAVVASLLYLLFFSYTHFNLAQIYPFLSLSVLLFFAIDIVIYKKRIPRRTVAILFFGIAMVALGSFLTGSTGFTFNYSLLPFIIAFIILGGVSDYLYFYKLKEYTIGSKTIAFDSLFFVLGIALMLSNRFTGIVHPYGIAYAFLGGFMGVTATVLELQAMKIYNEKKISRVVAERNFINNFTYLDTVLVLVGSIIIGSFTYQEVLGGMVLVAGILVISMAKEKGVARCVRARKTPHKR